MPRIRTIKPEFPHSESMSRVSRDARLLFVLMFTVADDEGRGRGDARLLASLLFPYDDDAPHLLPSWLAELVEVGCVLTYMVDRNTYFQIVKWCGHQKIDKPTPSRFPRPDGVVSANPSESDLKDKLVESIKKAGVLFGEPVIEVQREARVGSSYLDIVVRTEARTYVFEAKKGNITVADLKQVHRYADLASCVPVLIGPGLSPQFPAEECVKLDVAVICTGNDECRLLIASSVVTSCDITLDNARECQPLDLVSGPVSRTRKGNGLNSSELALQSSKPDAIAMPTDAIDQGNPDEETTETVALLWFPCAGKKDSWALQQPMVEELSQAFPAVDVLAECKKALAWVNANQKKKKTYSGMPKFITGWMSRVQDRGGTRGGPAMPSPNGPMPSNSFGSRLEGVEERISARMKGGP
jgi:hypothetical protein